MGNIFWVVWGGYIYNSVYYEACLRIFLYWAIGEQEFGKNWRWNYGKEEKRIQGAEAGAYAHR